ncbi:MAG: ankyrin repeat domain-containing protein, partial [Phycisphaerales bacterium]|nr:ankyrin repeat domain-containing protein [Phycisphaerales bacterium]
MSATHAATGSVPDANRSAVDEIDHDGDSHSPAEDESVAEAQSPAASSAMPIYITPYYNSQGPQINVGRFSEELKDVTTETALDLAATMEAEWTTLPFETMFVMAIRLFDLSHKDEAVYWFYSAQFRARLLIAIMEPDSVGGIGSPGFELQQAFAAFMQLSGEHINAYAFEDPVALRATLKSVMDEREIIPEFSTIYPRVELIEPDQWARQAEAVAENMQQLIDFVDQNADYIRDQGRAPGAFRMFTRPADRQLADAAVVGNIAGVDAALANGADVNAVGSDGYTPLVYVFFERGSKEGFEYLLEQGADSNILYDSGKAMIHLAASHARDSDWLRLCLEHDGDPNLRSGIGNFDIALGQTPLYDAVLSENLENMELLVEYGADVNVVNNVIEASPLYDALEFNKLFAAKWL